MDRDTVPSLLTSSRPLVLSAFELFLALFTELYNSQQRRTFVDNFLQYPRVGRQRI